MVTEAVLLAICVQAVCRRLLRLSVFPSLPPPLPPDCFFMLSSCVLDADCSSLAMTVSVMAFDISDMASFFCVIIALILCLISVSTLTEQVDPAPHLTVDLPPGQCFALSIVIVAS